MKGPDGVFCATAPGMPIAAGTWRAVPLTKMVRCAWMWKSVCSLVLQPIPSTVRPVALAAVPASAAALGMGTPSGPIGPAAGGACSGPSVLSAANDEVAEPAPPAAGADDPVASATETPATAPATTTAAPMTASRSRRLRRASVAFACSIARLLLSREPCLDTGHHPIY